MPGGIPKCPQILVPATTGEPVLAGQGLTKTYGGAPVFAGLDLEVAGAGVVALTGANGAGKSTLLKCLAGATRLDGGELYVAGQRANPSSATHWQRVHGILDDFAWLPDLTIGDHLRLLSPSPVSQQIETALTAFGISPLAGRLPESLSSGQRQRAALTTMLIRAWEVLLLDEPERHLDAGGVDLLASTIAGVAAPGRCVVIATHSSYLVERLACDVIALDTQEA